MRLENGQELYFGVAYWKKRWVGVPFFHLPPGAETEDGQLARFKVTQLDGSKIEPLAQRENKALEKIQVQETIVPWLWSEKSLKELCRENDLPLSWVTDRFPRKQYHTRRSDNRRELRKITSLTPTEFRRIRKELLKLNEQAALILRILWYLNGSIGPGGGFVTLEEIIRMQIQDVSPENENGSNWIRLQRIGMRSTRLVVHCLPPQLWKALCRQINEKSVFVFSTKHGGPLHPEQIDFYLKKAARIAGFGMSITSMSLRPPFNKQKVKKTERGNRAESYQEPVTPEEWTELCKQVPKILNRKGRKATHDPRALFNAMLYLEKTQCSFRKLPDHFPPWRAVASQQKRWRNLGVFDEIKALRKGKGED